MPPRHRGFHRPNDGRLTCKPPSRGKSDAARQPPRPPMLLMAARHAAAVTPSRYDVPEPARPAGLGAAACQVLAAVGRPVVAVENVREVVFN